jgi:hypothetical protein
VVEGFELGERDHSQRPIQVDAMGELDLIGAQHWFGVTPAVWCVAWKIMAERALDAHESFRTRWVVESHDDALHVSVRFANTLILTGLPHKEV